MKCPDDFTLSQYADGELPEEETGRLVEHFGVCIGCRKRAQAFEVENRLLTECLQGIELWEPELETSRRKNRRSAWIPYSTALLGSAVLLRATISYIIDKTSLSALDWIHPFSLSGLLNLLASGLFYFLEKGRPMITTLIDAIGTVIIGLLFLGALATLTRRMRGVTAMIGLTAMMLVFVVPSHAIEIRKAEKGIVSITAGETIDDSVVAFADSVDVRGTITGDLVTFARRINVQGTVQGNIITFGQNVDVSGNVEGDIFGFAQTLRANGTVGRNIWGFAQTVGIDSMGKLGQNATLFASNIDVKGTIGQDLTAFTAFLDIGGTVGRDLNMSGERLSVQDTSVIGRNLSARVNSEKNVQIHPDATIQGAKNISLRPEEAGPHRFLTLKFYFWQIIRLIGAFLMGLILFWLIPGMRRIPLADGRGWLTSGGVGFLAVVATPAAVLILAVTLIGLPVALAALICWLLALYLAKIVVGKFIGGLLLGNIGTGFGATASTLLLGLLIVLVAVNLPYIGTILNILLTIIGMGALLVTAFRLFPKRRESQKPLEAIP